ncbi:MAG TPA: RNA-binding protein, partial [Anaeromyxobacter sp.]
MSEEKKPETPGPVVVRKGHVKPPPPGVRLEAPQEEVLAPGPEKDKKERRDPRPLWQRMAEEKSGAPKAPGAAPPPGRRPPRGEGPRDRAERRNPHDRPAHP